MCLDMCIMCVTSVLYIFRQSKKPKHKSNVATTRTQKQKQHKPENTPKLANKTKIAKTEIAQKRTHRHLKKHIPIPLKTKLSKWLKAHRTERLELSPLTATSL